MDSVDCAESLASGEDFRALCKDAIGCLFQTLSQLDTSGTARSVYSSHCTYLLFNATKTIRHYTSVYLRQTSAFP